MNTREIAKQLIDHEIKEIEYVKNRLDSNFDKILDEIINVAGDFIIVGLGKSGIIAQKIAASMRSTGTRTLFIHAAEGMHGDLGFVRADDLVMIISHSGSSPEITEIIKPIKEIGARIIAMTGNKNSILAREAVYVLDSGIQSEGGSIGLAPFASTTAMLVLGDALTEALIVKKQFTKKDFAVFHPGGSLGRRLLTRVGDLMVTELPKVDTTDVFIDVVYKISACRLGMTLVYKGDVSVGIITDGDIRRNIGNYGDVLNTKAEEMMTKDFISINKNEMATTALEIMNKKKVTNLVVVDETSVVCGIVTIHNLINFE